MLNRDVSCEKTPFLHNNQLTQLVIINQLTQGTNYAFPDFQCLA